MNRVAPAPRVATWLLPASLCLTASPAFATVPAARPAVVTRAPAGPTVPAAPPVRRAPAPQPPAAPAWTNAPRHAAPIVATTGPVARPRVTPAALAPVAPPAAATTARTAPARVAPAPPAPPVALQLTGLRVSAPLSNAAVMHAIARDAWPALTRCVSPAPPVRGYTTVTVRDGASGFEVRFTGAPLTGGSPLAHCVRRAVAAVVLPPREDSDADAELTFDLVFNMPSVLAPRRAQPVARAAAPAAVRRPQ